MDLVYKNEKPLFVIAVVISALFWLAITLGTLGIVLIYLLLAYVFFLFAHSAFISHLKGSGVKISQEQYPDLYEKLTKGCDKIGLQDIPDAYLLRTDFFNALATKFLGRHFIVLFTDVVDALEDQPNAIDFYIGHELGHIHRKHLNWSFFIMPASVLPLLGTALRRAQEYTCDRYGVACCESEDDIKAAISAIAAGDSRWKSMNLNSYLKQVSYTKGFWMSFHELTGDYPWLTKRMATAIGLSKGKKVTLPKRHPFAWFLSCFIPRFGAGGAGSIIITVAIVGILAAVALPAYTDYTERARFTSAYLSTKAVQEKVTEYVISNNQWPEGLQTLGYADNVLADQVSDTKTEIYENGVIGVFVGFTESRDEKYVVLEPQLSDENVSWTCYGENIPAQHLPKVCR